MDTRKALEERANDLGVKFGSDISDDDLAKQIKAHEAQLAKDKPAKAQAKNTAKTSAKTGAKSQAKNSKGAANKGVVTVTGPEKGRRRIGRRFGLESVDIPAEDLSRADLALLHSDPTLAVSIS